MGIFKLEIYPHNIDGNLVDTDSTHEVFFNTFIYLKGINAFYFVNENPSTITLQLFDHNMDSMLDINNFMIIIELL
jgi:hypothetical protein